MYKLLVLLTPKLLSVLKHNPPSIIPGLLHTCGIRGSRLSVGLLNMQIIYNLLRTLPQATYTADYLTLYTVGSNPPIW